MPRRLPITVVLPTLNAMSLLPEHVGTMQQWLDLIGEVVVVDSESSDGTVDYLRQHLRHDKLRFFTRPRGLYQAWYFAIAQASEPYTYISTVGDAISRTGLIHLYQVAAELEADVVISSPDFIDQQGRPVELPSWPADRLIEMLSVDRPIRLDRWTAFGFSFLSIAQAILGSSASNLYRTECVQRDPFPVEYGTAGDCAWGLRNTLFADIALTPERVSFFREHEKSYDTADYAVDGLLESLDRLAEDVFVAALAEHPELRSAPEAAVIEEMIRLRAIASRCQGRLSGCRRTAWPWFLNPSAWRARVERDRARRRFAAQAVDLFSQASAREEVAAVLSSRPWLKWASSR